VHTGEIMVFVGTHFAITCGTAATASLLRRHWLEAQPDLLAQGPASVSTRWRPRRRLLPSVVNAVEEDIDEVETAVFTPRRAQDVEGYTSSSARCWSCAGPYCH